ncbi:hypothetical protein AUP68_06535 [Ilyonectria robusta]
MAAQLDVLEAVDAVIKQGRHAQSAGHDAKNFGHAGRVRQIDAVFSYLREELYWCRPCHDTDSRINNTTAVLRGLIYLLTDQQPSLIPHIQKKYNQADLYKQVLAITSVVYRPISLKELTFLAASLEDFDDDLNTLEEIIRSCSSLLTLREGVVYFVHQSAKDFLLNEASNQILSSGIAHQHRVVFSRSF